MFSQGFLLEERFIYMYIFFFVVLSAGTLGTLANIKTADGAFRDKPIISLFTTLHSFEVFFFFFPLSYYSKR